jgi:hypothetical protein
VTQRARIDEALFRQTARGREALAPPGEGGTHVHYQSPRHVGIGCITSKRPGSLSDLEYLAIKHGLTVEQVRKFLEEARDEPHS